MGIDFIVFRDGIRLKPGQDPEEVVENVTRRKPRNRGGEPTYRRGQLPAGEYELTMDGTVANVIVSDKGEGTIRIRSDAYSAVVDTQERSATVTTGARTINLSSDPDGENSYAITSSSPDGTPQILAVLSYVDKPNPAAIDPQLLGSRLRQIR